MKKGKVSREAAEHELLLGEYSAPRRARDHVRQA